MFKHREEKTKLRAEKAAEGNAKLLKQIEKDEALKKIKSGVRGGVAVSIVSVHSFKFKITCQSSTITIIKRS